MHWSWEKTRLMAHAYILKKLFFAAGCFKKKRKSRVLLLCMYVLTYVLFSNDCSSSEHRVVGTPYFIFSPSDTKGLQLLGSFFLAMSFWHHLSKQDWNSLFLAQLGPDCSGHGPFLKEVVGGLHIFPRPFYQSKQSSFYPLTHIWLDPQKRRLANT